ncbi:MAG TPA: hypothetical protein VFE26_10420 [Trebonia sp.]|nr:hypothetical protein [Trebonia sp.]
MSVERIHAGYQTRYELRDEVDARPSCVLTYTADPDSAQLQAWLAPIVGGDRAAELAVAVDAAPPGPAAWQRTGDAG